MIGAANLKLDAERRACEIRLRAERRAGQLLSKMEKAKGGQPYQSGGTMGNPKTLKAMGIDKKLSTSKKGLLKRYLREKSKRTGLA